MKPLCTALATTVLLTVNLQTSAGVLDHVQTAADKANTATSKANAVASEASNSVNTVKTQAATAKTATSAGAGTSPKMDMVNMVTSSLGVNQKQAQGGLGAIFSQVQGNLPPNQFSQISNAVPGIDGLLAAAPVLAANSKSESGLGKALGMAGSLGGKAASAAKLTQQFQMLGLNAGMVGQFGGVIKHYFDNQGMGELYGLVQQGLAAKAQ